LQATGIVVLVKVGGISVTVEVTVLIIVIAVGVNEFVAEGVMGEGVTVKGEMVFVASDSIEDISPPVLLISGMLHDIATIRKTTRIKYREVLLHVNIRPPRFPGTIKTLYNW
jgi:hypothetical protein